MEVLVSILWMIGFWGFLWNPSAYRVFFMTFLPLGSVFLFIPSASVEGVIVSLIFLTGHGLASYVSYLYGLGD